MSATDKGERECLSWTRPLSFVKYDDWFSAGLIT